MDAVYGVTHVLRGRHHDGEGQHAGGGQAVMHPDMQRSHHLGIIIVILRTFGASDTLTLPMMTCDTVPKDPAVIVDLGDMEQSPKVGEYLQHSPGC